MCMFVCTCILYIRYLLMYVFNERSSTRTYHRTYDFGTSVSRKPTHTPTPRSDALCSTIECACQHHVRGCMYRKHVKAKCIVDTLCSAIYVSIMHTCAITVYTKCKQDARCTVCRWTVQSHNKWKAHTRSNSRSRARDEVLSSAL